MTKKTENVTPFQLFSITLFSMSFGLNLYPSSFGHAITHEWFIGLAVSAALIIPVLLMQLRIFKFIEAESLSSSVQLAAGKVSSKILGVLFFVYFLLHAIRLTTLEANDIQLFLFDKTPFKIIALVIIITAFIISLSGPGGLCKLTEILAVPLLLTIFITLAMFLSSSDFGEVKTLFQLKLSGIFHQVINSVSCFACIETTLFFVCRVKNKNRRKLALLGGYSACALILLILSVCIIGIFTLRAGANLIYPVTELARTVQLKYLRIIERFDTITLVVRIISVCVFVALTCHCSAEALSMVFHPKKFRYSIPVYLILLFVILFGYNESINQFISDTLIYCEITVLFAVIPILFLISLIKKRGDNSCDAKVYSCHS